MNRDRKRIRLQDWDYSSEGIYFITISCHDNTNYFGKIVDNKIDRSKLGNIASELWKEIPKHFPHIILDEFVIMPNHIHGILILDYTAVGTRHGVSLRYNNGTYVGPCHGMALPDNPNNNFRLRDGVTLPENSMNRFSKPNRNSVSVIINQYKSAVKRWCNKNGFHTFRWQSRFYDHIIRDEESIVKVREYIRMNPRNWISDDLNG